MRDDPQFGETVALIVTQSGDEPAALDALASHLEAAGATIEAELRFGALRVRVAESDVATLCTLDGIDAIETATTRSLDAGDTGEDVCVRRTDRQTETGETQAFNRPAK